VSVVRRAQVCCERLWRSIVGDLAEKHRGVLKLSRPVRHGAVENWEDLEALWSHAVTDSMKVSFKEHPLLVTEAPLGPVSLRTKLAEFVFETLGAPALFVSPQAPLSLYAAARTTGLVVDVGEGVTQVVPIYEGLALSHAVVRTGLAGGAITDRLQHLLRKSGLALEGSSAVEVCREIKESVSVIAPSPSAAEASARAFEAGASTGDKEMLGMGSVYRLPDGRTFSVGPEAFRAPELLFQPSTAGVDCPGLHEAVAGSISRCDMEVRSALWGGVLLSGGTTLTPGFGRRLVRECKALAPTGTKVSIAAPKTRDIATWVGGSILSSLSTFSKLWIDKAQWEEAGSTALHRAAI
jgi:actin-related protein